MLGRDADRLRSWMFEHALPLWWDRAGDRVRGGWFDVIAQDGSTPEVDRRARVQARQTYVYALAGRLGWSGPWRLAAEHGLEYLARAFRTACSAQGSARTGQCVTTRRCSTIRPLCYSLSPHFAKFRPSGTTWWKRPTVCWTPF